MVLELPPETNFQAIEEKKRRQSAKFFQFFNKVEKKAPEPQKKFSSWYMPFQRKDGMTLAPILTRDPLPEDFDLFKQNKEVMYTEFDQFSYFKSFRSLLLPISSVPQPNWYQLDLLRESQL